MYGTIIKLESVSRVDVEFRSQVAKFGPHGIPRLNQRLRQEGFRDSIMPLFVSTLISTSVHLFHV